MLWPPKRLPGPSEAPYGANETALPWPLRANARPGEFDDRRAEQVAAQRDGVAPRDIALRADRLEPDETSVGQGVHARIHAAAGIAQANGNFESVEWD